MQPAEHARRWKVRRVIAGLRQMDVARECGLATTRYSEIERGLRAASSFEEGLIERQLPQLPDWLFDQNE
jgi:hypothetical protein